ncbi:MAG TPA: hypothetical protein VF177_00550 [Anaerolineae bacterium]
MTDKSDINRRQFLTLILGLGLATFMRPPRVWSWLARRFRHEPLSVRFAHLFRQKESAKVIGQAYLQAIPAEADVQTLTDLIAASLAGDQELVKTSTAELRPILERQMRQDFDQGRVANVEGWLLSETEARLCALAALV